MQAGRHGAGDVAESSTFRSSGNKESDTVPGLNI